MGRPAVTVCYTQSLDGRLATATGQSQWIGCSESLCHGHALRASHDAIMVGVGTVRQDNPRLTVRHVAGRDPLRVVVDSALRTSLDAAVLAGSAAAGTLIATTDRAEAARRAAVAALGAMVLVLPTDPAGRVDLGALLAALARRGVGSVLTEGGATLITSLLRLRLADRIEICVAPKIIGAGLEAVGDLGIRELGSALDLADVQVTAYGPDIVVAGRIVYPAECAELDDEPGMRELDRAS